MAVTIKKVGVIGAGTMGAYVTPELAVSFFEIDPVVIRVAEDPRYFTYLSDAPQKPRVVLGDARLSLEDEPAGIFDLVLLDAFSSDSIPVHLITAEAIAIEWRTVRPGGLIGFNVGVELGQLAVIVLAYLATTMWFGRQVWYRSRIVVPASAAIALTGLFWTVQRVFYS